MRKKEELEKIGRYMGYPDCCVQYFLCHCGNPGWNNYVRGSWAVGTGYIPCPDCMEKPSHILIQEISRNRSCPTPFPHDVFERTESDLKLEPPFYAKMPPLPH